MAKQAQAVSFDETMITDTVDQIKAIDVRLSAVLGTQAERLKVARTAVLEQSFDSPYGLALFAPDPTTTFGDVLAYIEGDLASWLAEVDNAADEAVTAYLKDHKSANADEVDTLKAERTVLVERAKALGTLLGVDVDIPKRSGGSSSGGSVKVSGAHFQVCLNGKVKEMSGSQDKLSSVAWYHGRALVPDGTPANGDKGVTTADLTKAVETALGGSIPATDWVAHLHNGNTVSMVVIPTEEDAK